MKRRVTWFGDEIIWDFLHWFNSWKWAAPWSKYCYYGNALVNISFQNHPRGNMNRVFIMNYSVLFVTSSWAFLLALFKAMCFAFSIFEILSKKKCSIFIYDGLMKTILSFIERFVWEFMHYRFQVYDNSFNCRRVPINLCHLQYTVWITN